MALHDFVGPHLTISGCDTQADQMWIFNLTDGTIRNKLNGQCVTVEAELEVWASPLVDGSQAVLLFNRGNTSESITVQWTDIDFPVRDSALVRDIWARKPLGAYRGNYTSPKIDPHAVMMLKFTLYAEDN